MQFTKAIAIAAIFAAGVAYAQDARTDPNAIARSELMSRQGKNAGILGGMASGKAPYDAAAAEAAKAALIETSSQIEAIFKEQGAADPVSEAKPEIWSNWEDFLTKASALNAAATAADVSSVESIGVAMAAIGGACSECHKVYRVKK